MVLQGERLAELSGGERTSLASVSATANAAVLNAASPVAFARIA